MALHARLKRIRKYIYVLRKEETRILDDLQSILTPRVQLEQSEELLEQEYKALIERGIINDKE